MVDFGSEQGLSDFESDSVAVIVSTGIACYFEDFKVRGIKTSFPKPAG